MQVLLLDEITVDLDVLARADLLTFLVSECEERGATIVYATHIFDGLDKWATHIVSRYSVLLLLLSPLFLAKSLLSLFCSFLGCPNAVPGSCMSLTSPTD